MRLARPGKERSHGLTVGKRQPVSHEDSSSSSCGFRCTGHSVPVKLIHQFRSYCRLRIGPHFLSDGGVN